MDQIIRFAIATAMTQEEIIRVVWDYYAPWTKMLIIRDRKDPREKAGNDHGPLLKVSGYDAAELMEARLAARSRREPRIFPANPKSAGTAFTRACKVLRILHLHFHDLRQGTSGLFQAGFQIPQVALVTGQ
jgi:integrase